MTKVVTRREPSIAPKHRPQIPSTYYAPLKQTFHIKPITNTSLTKGINNFHEKRNVIDFNRFILSLIHFSWRPFKSFLFRRLFSCPSIFMDDRHRVYPVDSFPPSYMHPSEQQQYAPRYVMLGEDKMNDSQGIRPPPYRRNIPRYHSEYPKKKSGCKSCLKCICCCYCFLIALVLLLIGMTATLYHMYKPQIPTYKVVGMDVGAFEVRPDFSLYTKFIVSVEADNPNEKIGVIYLKGSSVKAFYKDSILCSGNLPAFYQGHKNNTVLKVSLDGVSTFGSGLQELVATSNKHPGGIPLAIKVRAPVSVVLGTFPLKTVTVVADIALVVDKLEPGKKIEILSSKYKIWVEVSDQHVYKIL